MLAPEGCLQRVFWVRVVGCVILFACASCGNESGQNLDLGSVTSVCNGARESLELLRSDNSSERSRGHLLAERIWVGTEINETVSIGVRDECPKVILDMIEEAGLSFDGYGA